MNQFCIPSYGLFDLVPSYTVSTDFLIVHILFAQMNRNYPKINVKNREFSTFQMSTSYTEEDQLVWMRVL